MDATTPPISMAPTVRFKVLPSGRGIWGEETMGDVAVAFISRATGASVRSCQVHRSGSYTAGALDHKDSVSQRLSAGMNDRSSIISE